MQTTESSKTPRIEAIVFSSVIPPGHKANICIQPAQYSSFRPERLVYKGPPKSYRLCAFYIGKNSQFFVLGNPVSMDYFAPGAKEQAVFEAFLRGKAMTVDLRKILNNLGTCDFCRQSMNITLVVENIAPGPQTSEPSFLPGFECVMYGEVSEGASWNQ